MTQALFAAVLAGGLALIPGGASTRPADDTKKEREPVTGKRIVDLLHDTPISYSGDFQSTPLIDVLQSLAKQYEITFVINNTTSGWENPALVPDAKATGLSAARLEGLTLGRFLDVYLRGLSVPDVTYLVRDYGIEITSRQRAQEEAGLVEAVELTIDSDEPGASVRARARQNLPLVCVAVDDAPLGEVIRKVARVYGLNVVLDKVAQNAAAQTTVTERLLNVPADTALELLAAQAGLEVIRKGNTFRIGGGGGAQ